MECDRFTELLPELLAGELPVATAAEAEAHARACAACGRELADHRRSWQLLGVLDEAVAVAPERLAQMAQRALAQSAAEEAGGPVDATTGATVRVLPTSRWRRWQQLAAAAVLVAGTALTTRFWMERNRALPDFLDDADFVQHFELLRDLPDLDGEGDLLDVDDELLLLQAMRGA
ncbi:MAG: zf-HC2 domain-containing protein [Planctomycetes bacterium]|nr:zf-HC2 domain-containing protein [Planctomycetota bacterium]